ncbi:MAG TPA: phosphate-starvation-inducible PsiE family protein [Pelomicrobium sp.]|nr:phosphate-starvation-inducible PsiE family protein [Pelomicrobium sp.]
MTHPLRDKVESVGNLMVTGFHLLGLFVIGASIVWSAALNYIEIMQQGYAKLDDLLLLFIYLELGAMVGIYFKTHRLPVRFLVYVAITALTRYLVVDVKELSALAVMEVAASITLLAVASVLLEYAINKLRGNELDH